MTKQQPKSEQSGSGKSPPDAGVQANASDPAGAWSSPAVQSLLITLGFFAIFYGLLHPGYAILDDVKMISIVVGYPGVQPAPFLIFSNVLLGLVLAPLYAMGTAVNWDVILFCIVNLLSVWVLLYSVLSSTAAKRYKLLGGALLLACASYYALNITFSTTAALAAFAGLSAVITGARMSSRRWTALVLAGLALIVFASLVRIQMLYLTLPLLLASIPFLYRLIRMRELGLALALAAALVFGGYAFDRLYVRANPAWNTYYFYNKIAQMVQDSHRLENMHLEIRRIGWSGNDQELFARSFFPDAGLYSVDRLRYLAEHVSGVGQDPFYAARSLMNRVAAASTAPFLLVCLVSWLWAFVSGASKGMKAAIPFIFFVTLGEAFGLIWIYKNPEYVLLASVANTAMLSILIHGWNPTRGADPSTPRSRSAFGSLLGGACVVVGIAAVAVSAALAIQRSNDNQGKQAAYARILADLGRLQADGTLAKDAVIISPAYGIPVDWANPFTLDFPKVPFLDTGWSTFSPPYEEALHNFGIDSLPEALYQKPNLYLMSETIFKTYLARYYEEHGGTTVTFETVYTLGYPDRYEGYHEVELYKVVKTP
jgi:hypothetical protein